MPALFSSMYHFYTRLRYPRIYLISFFLCIILIVVILPPAYQESWLDPLNTLNVPDRVLHPHAFSQIGLMDPSDPFHPHFFADRQKVKELMRDLQHATLASTNQTQKTQKDEKIYYFTLHREATRFHSTEDFYLQYLPKQNIVFFGDQHFLIDNATTLLLNDIIKKMKPGWWK